MRIGFKGQKEDRPEIRAGFVGCGSHSFRNVYPVFQFAPVKLVAVSDLDVEKARLFADKFGAENAYADYREMLEKERLDAVFVVVGYDERRRPMYPDIAVDCMRAGCHVWIEKPPAASCEDILRMRAAEKETGKMTAVGFKKMFFPANVKAKEIADSAEFGGVGMVSIQYPQAVPTKAQFDDYLARKPVAEAQAFLDHICHPVSLLLYLAGMPKTLYYERGFSGAASAVFTYENGMIANLALNYGSSLNGGMERTVITSAGNLRHVSVENNTTVKYCINPSGVSYGDSPSFYKGSDADATRVWEPEFSLGQLYNKGIFLLGYCGEITEFANAVLEKRAVSRGGLADALKITGIFEAFAKGPGVRIGL